MILTKRCNATRSAGNIAPQRGNATTYGILLRKNGILLRKNGILLPQKIRCYRSKLGFRNRKYFDYFFKILFFDFQSNEIMYIFNVFDLKNDLELKVT